MLKFDPLDPFPVGDFLYPEAQAHSAEVDRWLGLRTEETEREIALSETRVAHQELWIGLAPERLLTPYTELREMLERVGVKDAQTVVDLGAAYGRMGFVMARHFPGARFVGYEFVGARVREGRRLLKGELTQADLAALDFVPVSADLYFIYDYGSRLAILKTLEDLKTISLQRPIVVIGRGRRVRDLIEREEPWLSQVAKPEHFANYSIYRSRE